jgi:hypothetical protein
VAERRRQSLYALLEKLMARRRRIPDLIADCRRNNTNAFRLVAKGCSCTTSRCDPCLINPQSYNGIAMLHPFVLHNDEIRGASEPILAGRTSRTTDGLGRIQHAPRSTNGVLFAFERHWARMKRDAETAAHPLPFLIPSGFGIGCAARAKPMTARTRRCASAS